MVMRMNSVQEYSAELTVYALLGGKAEVQTHNTKILYKLAPLFDTARRFSDIDEDADGEGDLEKQFGPCMESEDPENPPAAPVAAPAVPAAAAAAPAEAAATAKAAAARVPAAAPADAPEDGEEAEEEAIRADEKDDAKGGPRDGTGATFHKVEGKYIMVPQHVHYVLRGICLADLSMYEYFCTVELRKTAQAGADSIPLDPRHPLYATHRQVLLKKLAVPVLSESAPSYPGPRRANGRDSWYNRARHFAMFYTLLFVPWDALSLKPPPFTWRAFCERMREWHDHQDELITAQRLKWICNMAQGFSVCNSVREMLSEFRLRDGLARPLPFGATPRAQRSHCSC